MEAGKGPDGPVVLKADGLVREFGTFRAVDGISFQLTSGTVMAVFGPNGAGRTSLLRILAGELQPTEGSVEVHGTGLNGGDQSWRARVGVLSHQSFLYDHLTAQENLLFYGRLFELPNLKATVAERLEEVGLLGRAGSRVRTFSRGMRQRLALARTLLHDPDVVFLDEPYTGLDAHAAGLLNEVLASLRDARRTVVLVTHNLSKGLHLADRVAIQVRGRFAYDAGIAELPDEAFEGFYRRVVDSVEAGR
jgi:heme exporter protein A